MIRTQRAEKVPLERVEEIAQGLASALAARRLYHGAHPRAREALRDITRDLRSVVGDGGPAGRLRFTVARGGLQHQGIPLAGSSALSLLASRLEECGAGGLSFGLGVTEGSIAALFDWLGARDAEPVRHFGGIEVLPPQREEEPVRTKDPAAAWDEMFPEFRVPARIYRSAAELLDRVLQDSRFGREVDMHEVLELSHWAAEEAFASGMKLVGPVQHSSGAGFTYRHSVNVFLIATALLQPFARSDEELAVFAQAALLHDVGKSRIPEEILLKRGRLTDAEFAVMRLHPEFGAEILQAQGDVDPLIVHVAYCHHMRDAGHGYPTPQTPVDIGPVTAVVQVADMFEALTAKRPYKASRSVKEAAETIHRTPGMESRRPYLGLLLRRLTLAPPGSEVILSSGERGIVLEARPEAPRHPVVKLLGDDAGRIDLADPGEDRQITRVVFKPVVQPA